MELDSRGGNPGEGEQSTAGLSATTRLKQTGIVALGLALAAAMVVLGVWQLDVYHSQGRNAAQDRANEPAVALTQVAPAGSAIIDGYGRTVSLTGTYDTDLQLIVPVTTEPGTYRVLTGLRQADGSIVPVVRGTVRSPEAPKPPSRPVQEQGVLLPTEAEQPGSLPMGQVGSVRIPALAQSWPGPLVGGYVTLTSAASTSQGLDAFPVVLPEGQGRLRNGAYALQWWVFAAFALGMAIRMARDVEVQDALNSLGPAGTSQAAVTTRHIQEPQVTQEPHATQEPQGTQEARVNPASRGLQPPEGSEPDGGPGG